MQARWNYAVHQTAAAGIRSLLWALIPAVLVFAGTSSWVGLDVAIESLQIHIVTVLVAAIGGVLNFLRHFLYAPLALERIAHAETMAELNRLRGEATLSRDQEAALLRDSESFALWQAACIAGHAPYVKPVTGGLPTYHLEELKRDFIRDKIQLMMPPAEARLAQALQASSFGGMVPEIRDTERISRDQFKGYLAARNIVPALTDAV